MTETQKTSRIDKVRMAALGLRVGSAAGSSDGLVADPASDGTAQEAPAGPVLAASERKAALERRVTPLLATGRYRVETRSDFHAALLSGSKPNHVLHFILSVLTLGLWLFVWLFLRVLARQTAIGPPTGRQT